MTGTLVWEMWLFPSSSRYSLMPHVDKVASTLDATIYTTVPAAEQS